MYEIVYYAPKETELFMSAWKELEKGSEMTCYQSFDWYKSMVCKTIIPDSYFHTSIVAIVKKGNEVCIIAPIFVMKHSYRRWKKGMYLLDQSNWADYHSFIYKDFDLNAFEFLLSEVKSKYNVSELYLNWHVKNSLFCHITQYPEANITRCIKCASIAIAKSEEEYYNRLSKNTRQNIRTAINRLKKDGVSIKFNFDDTDYDKKRAVLLHEKRVEVKEKKTKENKTIHSLYYNIKRGISKIININFPIVNPIFDDINTHIMSAYDDDKLIAYFSYRYDNNNNNIIVMEVGLDDKYKRYSPGVILLYNYIVEKIRQQDLNKIDLTAGNETYKMKLGAELHYIYDISCKI